jgi:guanine deaminase
VTDDLYFLKKAIEIGNKKAQPYNFGAVVVKDGEILAIDHNHVHETNNPTLHAECSAIIQACQKIGTNHITGTTLYASHGPCMMCLSCAFWAKVDRIVFSVAASEQDQIMYELKDFSAKDFAARLPSPIKIEQVKIQQ